MSILAATAFWKVFASALFLMICVLLVVVVLLQRGRGGGLSGAFGGAGGYSPFGAKTGDFFTWLTVGLAGLFLLMAIINNFAFRKVTVAGPPAARPGQPLPGQAPPPGPGAGAGVPITGANDTTDGGDAAPGLPGPAGSPTPTPAEDRTQDTSKE